MLEHFNDESITVTQICYRIICSNYDVVIHILKKDRCKLLKKFLDKEVVQKLREHIY